MSEHDDRREAVHETPPYSALAAGYDVVMSHVQYDIWAEYIHGLILEHFPEAVTVLELGCGTGSLAFELQPIGDYRYAGTDGSAQMIEVARRKSALYNVPLQLEVADFTNYRVDRPVDVALLLFDGLNYLLEKDAIADLLACTFRAVKPGGIFIVDQSTPANSVNNEEHFHDEGEADEFTYVRHSHYDAESRIHTTTLALTIEERTYEERHLQKAYEMAEIGALIDAAGFDVAAAYDGFSTAPATEASERIHWVLRRPRS